MNIARVVLPGNAFYTDDMNESFFEQNKVVPIERALEIQQNERAKEERAIMQELEKRVPLLFAFENELIVARRYAKAQRLSHGVADNAPHVGESVPGDDMSEHIETLIDEIAYIKAEMEELLEKMRVLEEERKELFDREQQLKERHSDN